MKCKMDGCDKGNKAKGYCATHYQRKYSGEVNKKRLNEKYVREFDHSVFLTAFRLMNNIVIRK